MKMKRAIALSCGVLMAVLAVARDANKEFRDYMSTARLKTERAFAAKDVAFFEAMTTSDFTQTMMGKTSNREQAMAGMKQMFGMCKTIKCSLKLQSSKVSGETAVAMVSSHMTAMVKPQSKKDKTHKLVSDELMKMTWVRDGKAWKVKSIEDAKPAKMTMDGKPYTPPKPDKG